MLNREKRKNNRDYCVATLIVVTLQEILQNYDRRN